MNLRAKGAGVATAATWVRESPPRLARTHPQLATLILLQVAPIAFDNIGWKFFIAFIVFNISDAIIAYFCFPETAGKTLEEIGERSVTIAHQADGSGVLFGDENVQVAQRVEADVAKKADE